MSLVAWFQLNGKTDNNGLSGSILSGTPSYNTGKLSGQALSLSTRLTGTIPELVGAKTWSIAFWCLVNADESLSSNWVDILGVNDRKSDDSATGEFRWETCYGSSKDSVAIGQYDNNTYATVTASAGTLIATKGDWHHCVAVTDFENSKVDFYLDGILKATKVHAGGWLLGNFWLGQNDVVNGSIQDVRFYDHALSVKEVKELSKGLCMHFPLDWGGNPNMIKNSYTWMNKNTTSSNNNSCTVTKSVIEDEYTPCRYVYKCQMANANTSNKNNVGGFFNYTSQGLALTDLAEGETYTYSFWAKADAANTSDITLSAQQVCEGQTLVSSTGFSALDTNWRKHTVTFRWTNTAKLTACFYVTIPASSTQTYYLCGIKLEKGSKVTPYIPNVEENAYIMGGYSDLIIQDVSGYNKNATNTACTAGELSPRNIVGTNFVAKTSHFVMTGLNTTYTASTVSIWAKLDSDSLSTSSNNTSNIVALGNNTFQRFRVHTGGDGLWYYFDNNAISATFTVTNLLDNKWHHYVLTWEGGVGAKFYLDGSLINTTNNTSLTSITPTNNSWRLGEYSSNTETFDGQLSDFRFYATTLSADDIKELYQVSAQIDKSGKMYCSTYIEE